MKLGDKNYFLPETLFLSVSGSKNDVKQGVGQL